MTRFLNEVNIVMPILEIGKLGPGSRGIARRQPVGGRAGNGSQTLPVSVPRSTPPAAQTACTQQLRAI